MRQPCCRFGFAALLRACAREYKDRFIHWGRLARMKNKWSDPIKSPASRKHLDRAGIHPTRIRPLGKPAYRMDSIFSNWFFSGALSLLAFCNASIAEILTFSACWIAPSAEGYMARAPRWSSSESNPDSFTM